MRGRVQLGVDSVRGSSGSDLDRTGDSGKGTPVKVSFTPGVLNRQAENGNSPSDSVELAVDSASSVRLKLVTGQAMISTGDKSDVSSSSTMITRGILGLKVKKKKELTDQPVEKVAHAAAPTAHLGTQAAVLRVRSVGRVREVLNSSRERGRTL